MTSPADISGASIPAARAGQTIRHGRSVRFAPLGGNPIRLFLTSATILFVELMLIRWVPANVTYVGFFSNFLLMASFLGIGLGIILGRGGRRLPILPFAVLLLAVVWLVYNFQLNVKAGSSNELFFGLAESHSADINFLALPLVVVLVTGLLATLALPLGPLLRSMPPLKAYAIDIIGSMAGIAGFTLLSAGGTDPLVWFGVTVVLVALLELGGGLTLWSGVGALALGGVMLLVFNQATGPQGQLDTWSPYYRITTLKYADGPTSLNVNGIPHQTMHAVAGYKEPFYDQIYKWFPGKIYQNVLIVGAGSGTDVANALAHGAQHIDAVEIDPAIQQIGIDQHPDHPYQDPRVTRYINDGRAFLRSTDKKYDLILFALPDSLTLVSTTANLRLESFLFTQQAFESARDHLTDDGTFVLYNYYRQDWLVTKLADMLQSAFGTKPLLRMFQQVSATMADGPAVAALVDGQPPGDVTEAIPTVGDPTPKEATDDWPFLYLRTPFIADYYLVAIGLVLLMAFLLVAGAAKISGTSLRRFSPHFFVLGVAFLLLETRALVSFSLLFGTTWLVNALTFFAILCSVLLAIFVNWRWPIRRPTPFYVALFVALGIAFLVPPESLLIDPPWLRYVAAGVLAFAPVFLANLVFSYSFRETKTADMAFASNLLGAMVGGMLEYIALITGYQSLLIVVALLYLLAYVFASKVRMMADKDLEPEQVLATSAGSPSVAVT